MVMGMNRVTGLALRLAALLLLASATSGCSALLVAAADNAISEATQKDCAVSRILRGDPVCRGADRKPVEQAIYCHRSLGGVDCYGDPDPHHYNEEGRTLKRTILSDAAAMGETGNEAFLDGFGAVKDNAIVRTLIDPPGLSDRPAGAPKATNSGGNRVRRINNPPSAK